MNPRTEATSNEQESQSGTVNDAYESGPLEHNAIGAAMDSDHEVDASSYDCLERASDENHEGCNSSTAANDASVFQAIGIPRSQRGSDGIWVSDENQCGHSVETAEQKTREAIRTLKNVDEFRETWQGLRDIPLYDLSVAFLLREIESGAADLPRWVEDELARNSVPPA